MKLPATLAPAAAALALGACASAPPLERYVFPLPDVEHERAAPQREPEVVVALPDYLRGEGIALETDEGAVRKARYHLWAESLDTGIARYLEQAFAQALEEGEGSRLVLSIDRFHGDESGEVVLRGSWRWAGEQAGAASARPGRVGRFALKEGLEEPGYAALVAAHGRLLRRLAERIAAERAAGADG